MRFHLLQESDIPASTKLYNQISSNQLKDFRKSYITKTKEIGAIAWFTIEQALERIRDRHVERKAILNQIYEDIFQKIKGPFFL